MTRPRGERMTTIRVGLAQIPQTADLEANLARVMSYLDRAASAGVDILCFPEAQIPGYRADITPQDAPVQSERLAESTRMVAERCGELGMACILGTETPMPGRKPLNSVAVIDERGRVVGTHAKTILTPLDAKAYTAGSGFGVWELKGVPCGVVICFEGFRFPHTTRECVAQGARIVFHPQNNTTRPNTEWKIPVHEAMAVTRAAENTVFFVSTNICIEHQNCRSLVVGPDGTIRAASELRREELIVADVDPAEATRAMYRFEKEGIGDLLFGSAVKREEYAGVSERRCARLNGAPSARST